MKTRFLLLTLFLLIFFCCISLVNAQLSPNRLTLATNKGTYDHSECVTVHGLLYYNLQPANDGLIGLQINDPKGNILLTRTLTTGASSAPICPIKITTAYSSGSANNPQSTLEAGYIGYFTVKIANTETALHEMIVTLSLFDNSNVPLGQVSIPASLMGSQTGTVTVSLPIPLWAAAGTAYGYACVYTDLPSNLGFPLALEYPFQFAIINGLSGSSVLFDNNAEPDSYSFMFILPQGAIDGSYAVSACTSYGGNEYFENGSFMVKLLSDFNGDKILDHSDVLLFVQSYKDYTFGNTNYDKSCDLNNDGHIDYSDVLLFTQSYIKYWSCEK